MGQQKLVSGLATVRPRRDRGIDTRKKTSVKYPHMSNLSLTNKGFKTMKSLPSLACFVTGIAMIAVVVPVARIEYVLAQTVTTKDKHYCKSTDPHTPETPVDVFCDHSTGSCNEKTKYFHQPVNECLYNGAEDTSCYSWMGPAEYRKFPIIFVDQGLGALQLALDVGGGIVLCSINSAMSGGVALAIGFTPLGAGIVGLVTSVLCGLEVYAANLMINSCDFGYCKVDWTNETVGPNRTHCY
jgi:uncharacterized membrane protein